MEEKNFEMSSNTKRVSKLQCLRKRRKERKKEGKKETKTRRKQTTKTKAKTNKDTAIDGRKNPKTNERH